MRKEAPLEHPNKRYFSGVLAYVGTPSDRAPNGARGHRINLTKTAVEEAKDTLIGMGVNVSTDLNKHDVGNKCGVITEAGVDAGGNLRIAGYLFARDFPGLITSLEQYADDFGFSFESAETDYVKRDGIFEITKVMFTGATLMLRKHAAYSNTSIRLEV